MLVFGERFEMVVEGIPDDVSASTQDGFQCILTQAESNPSIADATLNIPMDFGSIDSAILILNDPKGDRVARCLLAVESPEADTRYCEFNLRKDLLKQSYILLTRHDEGNVYIATVKLATFGITNYEAIRKRLYSPKIGQNKSQ